MTVVAIHQPNFLPWLGFFDKMARADVFVLLDSVQFSKGSWTNRVRAMVAGEPAWLTVPIQRPHGAPVPIAEIRIDDGKPWRNKLLGSLRASYGRASAFDEVYPLVEEIVSQHPTSLADLNICGIISLAEVLGLPPAQLVRSSHLEVDGAATDLLVAIVKAVGGDAYLVGGGAAGYQEDEAFHRAGIEVVAQQFVHPVYEHPSVFVEGLSVVDAAMCLGWRATSALFAER